MQEEPPHIKSPVIEQVTEGLDAQAKGDVQRIVNLAAAGRLAELREEIEKDISCKATLIPSSRFYIPR